MSIKKIIGTMIASAVLGIGLTIGLASAHVGTKPDLSCTSVSSDFTSFPAGNHDVTFVVDVNGTTTNVNSSFTGESGTASADISNLTTATGELNISAYAEWTDDGGGKTETQEVKLVCHNLVVTPPPTVTPPTPPTPVKPVEDFTNIPKMEGK